MKKGLSKRRTDGPFYETCIKELYSRPPQHGRRMADVIRKYECEAVLRYFDKHCATPGGASVPDPKQKAPEQEDDELDDDEEVDEEEDEEEEDEDEEEEDEDEDEEVVDQPEEVSADATVVVNQQ